MVSAWWRLGVQPPARSVQFELEPGRLAPAGRQPALVPDPHLPAVPAACRQRSGSAGSGGDDPHEPSRGFAGIGDVCGRGRLHPAAVPGDRVIIRRDQHLTRALSPVGSCAGEYPAQPDPVRGHAGFVKVVKVSQGRYAATHAATETGELACGCGLRRDDGRAGGVGARARWREIGIIRCGRASPGTGSGRWRPAGPAVPRRAHRLAGTFPVAV